MGHNVGAGVWYAHGARTLRTVLGNYTAFTPQTDPHKKVPDSISNNGQNFAAKHVKNAPMAYLVALLRMPQQRPKSNWNLVIPLNTKI